MNFFFIFQIFMLEFFNGQNPLDREEKTKMVKF